MKYSGVSGLTTAAESLRAIRFFTKFVFYEGEEKKGLAQTKLLCTVIVHHLPHPKAAWERTC